jgi:hypothetical protein
VRVPIVTPAPSIPCSALVQLKSHVGNLHE